MSKEIKKIRYGAKHSVYYTPSVISPILTERDENGDVVKINSDVYFLLRQKNLHQSIGVESIRAYIDSLERQPVDRPELTDEELFSLIEPKSINTLTDAYQYARYLESHSNDIKEKYAQLKAQKKAQDKYYSQFNVDKNV